MEQKCLLNDPNCDSHCAHCGWTLEEEARRKKQIAENGLTLCKDGVKKLIVKRDGGK